MKKVFTVLLFAMLLAGFVSGCSMTRGNIGHSITTDVQLSEANFKVLGSVTGEAQADYILGIGPTDQDLLSQAKRDMLSRADLVGGAKAIINVTTDIKHSGFIIWRQKKAYVSAEVIEFTK
jgi:hypothetical protein